MVGSVLWSLPLPEKLLLHLGEFKEASIHRYLR